MSNTIPTKSQRSGNSVRRAAVVTASFSVLAVTVGCDVEPSNVEASNGVAEARISSIRESLKQCSPQTCCFPSGGGWASDPFEDRLKALACTEPRAYAEAAGQSDWWFYSACPKSPEVTSLVHEYSKVAPYNAKFVVNACLEAQAASSGQSDLVFVKWDPTCPSCTYQFVSPNPIIPRILPPIDVGVVATGS
jgi:hypothetical protein